MHPYLKKKKKERKYPYLERRSLVHAANFLSSEVPCLKSTALVLLEFPSLTPHLLLVKKTFIYIQKTLTYPLLPFGTIGMLYVYKIQTKCYLNT
jgi:hypothetical protein